MKRRVEPGPRLLSSTGLGPLAREILEIKRRRSAHPGDLALRRELLALLIRAERPAEALVQVEVLQRELPGDPEVQILAALVRLGMGDLPGTLHALSGHPQEAEACAELGRLQAEAGQWGASERLYRHALALAHRDVEPWDGLIQALSQLGRVSEALALAREGEDRFGKARKLRAHFRYLRATLLLLQGHYEKGLACYEARLELPDGPRLVPLPLATWEGGALGGRTLLLRWEGGYGDAFMALRYAQVLEARGARVLVEPLPGCESLLETCKGVSEVPRGRVKVPKRTLQVPMMSLLHHLKVRPDRVSGSVPYLEVPKEVPHREALDARMALIPGPLRLGLAWAGNPTRPRARERSIPLEALAPLGTVPNVKWVGVQKGEGPRPAFLNQDLGPLFSNFSDVAHALSRLDGLVTIDSSLVHLAGGLGVPCWLLVPRFPDWRWMLMRSDSPFYPTVRIWRQPSPGDWTSVVLALTQALRRGEHP